MPYKSGKMKGELTTTEIRKLIRAHNVLVSIKIPKGSKREDIMAIVKKAGYMVDHEKQALRPVSKGKVKKLPVVDMNKATQVLPKPKTKEEKAVAKKSKDMKKKEKEDKIKAEGIKQGAAIQRVLAKKKVAPVKKTTPSNTKAAYKKGYEEGYEQGIDDVEGDVVGDDGGEILDPKAPIVTDYKNDDDRKAVIKGWKEGYLAATKKKTTPKKKASPSVVVDDDKSKEYLNKLKADLTEFNKKYTAAKFRKLDSKGRSKLLKEYNDDSAIIQKGNLEFKKKITDKDGNQTKFYNDYTTMISTIAEGYGKFSRVRKNIRKLI